MALQNGRAEAEAYAAVKARLGFTNQQLLRYVWWDAVGAPASAAASVFVGVSPSALLQQTQPT